MIDLHTHTNNSDGIHTPEELVRIGLEAGLSALAVTDHDSARGVKACVEEGKRQGLRVIPGIEINAKHDGHNTHIVGLFIDPDSQALRAFSNELVARRLRRNIDMIEKLQELGYKVDFDDFPEFAEGQIMTKGNFGKVMVQKGYFPTVSEAIEALMEKGKPAYIPKKSCTPQEAIDVIHNAGGLAFVAHFYQINKKDLDYSYHVAEKLLKYGADGIETRYSEFTPKISALAEDLASQYGKLRSGGSDFHGEAVKPGIKVGTGRGSLYVPDDYLTRIEEKVKHGRNKNY